MEDGLVLVQLFLLPLSDMSLNPCCNGRWSRTPPYNIITIIQMINVLILVVMEDGLVLDLIRHYCLSIS